MGEKREETVPAHRAGNGNKVYYVVILRNNKDINHFENYRDNLDLSQNAIVLKNSV
jgi:hypothetical protein